MLYVDLDELPQLVSDRMISDRRCAVASFLPGDHRTLASEAHDSDESPNNSSLRERVAHHVEMETGVRVTGPIRLLTQLRYFGYYFSPLNLYYCYDEQGEEVVAVVAEVSNTPWREQHLYFLHEGNRADNTGRSFEHAKTFHVSPFMDMDLQYQWNLAPPSDTLGVGLRNVRPGENQPFFAAQLRMSRRPLSRASMAHMQLRYPLMTAQIMGAIYFQAFKLWWKACPYYPHPKNQSNLPHPHTVN